MKPYSELTGRNLSAMQQNSLPLALNQRGASDTQLNSLFNKPRGGEPEDIVAYNVLKAQPGEEVHHQRILETIAPAYRNLNEADAAALTSILEARGYRLGNQLMNLINMPEGAHKNMHKITKALGAEVDINKGKYVGKMDPALQDLIDSGYANSLRYRADMVGRYLDKFTPALREAQDEVLTNYYANKGDLYLNDYIADLSNRLATGYFNK